jgi:hypothetical protein
MLRDAEHVFVSGKRDIKTEGFGSFSVIPKSALLRRLEGGEAGRYPWA